MQEYPLNSFFHVDSKFENESLAVISGLISQTNLLNSKRNSTPRDAYPNN